jgi:endo-1,3-1,4-beta-glycanase ExoK
VKPHFSLILASAAAISAWGTLAHATSSAEFYTTTSYQYGRFEASIRFPAGSGVVGAFFLWKDGSEVAGTF